MVKTAKKERAKKEGKKAHRRRETIKFTRVAIGESERHCPLGKIENHVHGGYIFGDSKPCSWHCPAPARERRKRISWVVL
jgi:hypothetical protein